ncbi:MAG: right-handed parallel beta-helix repeat-containing protein, partial [bacterium]
ITLPDSMFEGGYDPFRTPNATDEEMDLMPWALSWKGRLPYTLPRGLLFENGLRMQQMATYEDLVRVPGSYWVGPDGRTIHIHPYGGGDPNGTMFEAAVQPHIFKPQGAGFGFVRVSGLVFEHCANSFLRTGVGALYTMGGHHWIIENNTVRHVNSVGVEIGFEVFERQDKRYTPRKDPNLGHTIVRGNHIYDCGTAGIRGLRNNYALVEDNEIADCGWQDAEFHWETAGIKLLINTGTLVRNNHIARLQGASGIWLDWDNRNSRVTGNLIRDVSTVQGAVFVEASQHPNMVDNNVFWNIDGQGVRAADTDHLVIAHNLFGRIKEDLVIARVATDRSLGGRKLTSTNNRVVNNIFVDAAAPLNFGDPSNVADYNIYVHTGEARVAPLASEAHSITMQGAADLDERQLLLTWTPAQPLPSAPAVKGCDRDFMGRERLSETTVPGPFVGASHAGVFRLARQ